MNSASNVKYLIQLTDDELKSLGAITYLWAVVDDHLTLNSLLCSEFYKKSLSGGFKSSTFKNRIRAWGELIESLNELSKKEKSALQNLLSRIYVAERKRKHVTHGVAFRESRSGIRFTKSVAINPVRVDDEPTSLVDFADELSGLAGELVELLKKWGK
jgi:hypothetical protein